MPIKAIVSGAEKDIKRIPMKGQNLFDVTTSISGLIDDNGNVTSNFAYSTSEFIRLDVEFTISLISVYTSSSRFIRCGYYTESKQHIANDDSAGFKDGYKAFPFTPPDGTAYIRFSFITRTGYEDSNIMLNLGSTALPYEPYGYQEGWEVRDNQNRLIWGREETLTGTNSISFKGAGVPLKSVDIFGNTQQTGTPSPDNIIMPEFVGVRTAQLFDIEGTLTSGNAATLSRPDENTLRVTGTGTGQNSYRGFIIPDPSALLGKTVTISAKVTASAENTGAIRFYWMNGITAQRLIGGNTAISGDYKRTFTFPDSIYSGCDGIGILFSANFDGTAEIGDYVDYEKTMLNLGSTALPYEPYGYKLDISNGGENLFDKSTISLNAYPAANNTIAASPNTRTAYAPCTPNTTYTISKITSKRFIVAYTKNIPAIGETFYGVITDNEATKITITTGNDASYLIIFYYHASYDTLTENEIKNSIMLNLGSTAKPYSPYNRTTTPVYFGQTQTVRRIKKLVLTGDENWLKSSAQAGRYNLFVGDYLKDNGEITSICTHFDAVAQQSGGQYPDESQSFYSGSDTTRFMFLHYAAMETLDDFKSYLAAQYAAGTPVTVWYVLANEETGIVNEPLCKIGDYADELSSAIPIPTVKGQNLLTVDTTLPPSNTSITGHITSAS